MINYNISINKELADVVEREMTVGKYANRSEFFRDLIRDIFVRRSLDIEPIYPKTKEYEEINKQAKISKSKKEFTDYKTIRKECGA